jgi:carboxypeptidase Taq
MGGMGYFSTYSLGNLNASQLFHTATKNGSVREAFDNADYAPLLRWMRENVHAHGSTYLPQDLMKKATGEGTNPDYHLAHLKRRFLG